MKFVSSITIQSWGTGHRVRTGKEIENDGYRNDGGAVQSGTKQSESPNPCNLSMARLSAAALHDITLKSIDVASFLPSYEHLNYSMGRQPFMPLECKAVIF